jgi:hypothetical protein
VSRILVSLAAVACVVSFLPASVAATPRPASRMLVYAQEWSLWPSRTVVPAGRVSVELWNRGQDAHDLHIRRLSRRGAMAGRAQKVPATSSGAVNTATWKLRAGRYELYCSMPGHRAHGMHVVLTGR